MQNKKLFAFFIVGLAIGLSAFAVAFQKGMDDGDDHNNMQFNYWWGVQNFAVNSTGNQTEILKDMVKIHKIVTPSGNEIIITNIKDINATFSKIFSNSSMLLNKDVEEEVEKQMERIKEIEKVYENNKGNATRIREEIRNRLNASFAKFISNITKNTSVLNFSNPQVREKFKLFVMEMIKETKEVEKKYVNETAKEFMKRHRFCIDVYPAPKECLPAIYPIFMNKTIIIRMPNGTIEQFNSSNISKMKEMLRNVNFIHFNEESKNLVFITKNGTSMSILHIIEKGNKTVFIQINKNKTSNSTSIQITHLIGGEDNDVKVNEDENETAEANMTIEHHHLVKIKIRPKHDISNDTFINITRINLDKFAKVNNTFAKEKLLKKMIMYQIHTNLNNTNIERALLTFVINQTWLNQQNATIKDVVIMRIPTESNTSQWQILKILNVTSTKVGNETYYNITAESPGFSYFVLTAAPLPTTGLPSLQPSLASSTTILLVGLVLAVAIYLAVYFRNRSKKNKNEAK